MYLYTNMNTDDKLGKFRSEKRLRAPLSQASQQIQIQIQMTKYKVLLKERAKAPLSQASQQIQIQMKKIQNLDCRKG